MLVEDSTANQMVVEALLDRLGYTVDVANNGLEAVASIQANHYDLVLMDLAMPEMDGFEATQVIRSMGTPAAETPIVALTADAFTADHQSCLDAGMNGYLSKPVDRAQLLVTVERWLGSNSPTHVPTGASSDTSTEALVDESALQSLREDLSDDLLPRMISAFVLEVSRRVPQIQRALAATNTIAAGEEAHALKGGAATFGARRLQALAERLERAATVGDIPKLMELNRDLAPLAERTIAEFKQRFRLETDD